MGMQVWAANGDRPTVKRVLMIGLDGLSVEGLEKAGTPNLDSLFKKGGALSVTTRAVMPSITLFEKGIQVRSPSLLQPLN